MPDEFSIIDRQRPTVRLARQSGWLLIALIAAVEAIRFFTHPASDLANPPITALGNFPVLTFIWHMLYAAFVVLVVGGIARGYRRMETGGHVCLVTAIAIHTFAILLFGPRPGSSLAIVVTVNVGAAVASYMRIWAIRQPARAELVKNGHEGP